VAGVITLSVALGVGIPLGWMLAVLANEATALGTRVADWVSAGAPAPQWVLDRPWIASRLQQVELHEYFDPKQLAGYVKDYGTVVSSQLVNLAGGVARNVFAFTIMLVMLFAFYTDGERLLQHARRLARVVFPNAPATFLDHVGGVVRAVVFGLLGTAIAQGVIAGIGFTLFGVPSPAMLGLATSVLSFVPVGPPLLWGGAAIWLFLEGAPWYLWVGMALWGAGLVSSVDNVLRPVLISSGPVRIPFLLVFLGVLGGLASMGVLGLFLGPVLLSVTFALMAEFPAPEAAAGGVVKNAP
jgi:predicted PurR-regulated permease PerM